MVNRENYLLITVWLFLIFAVGFGAFMGSALAGSNINFPPAGTAYAETTEALTSTMWQKLLRLRDATASATQWAYRGLTSWTVAFPTIGIPNLRPVVKVFQVIFKLMLVLLGLALPFGVILIPMMWCVRSANSNPLPTEKFEPKPVKEHSFQHNTEVAYVGNVVRFD